MKEYEIINFKSEKTKLICGEIGDDDKVNIRKIKSNIDGQLQLF